MSLVRGAETPPPPRLGHANVYVGAGVLLLLKHGPWVGWGCPLQFLGAPGTMLQLGTEPLCPYPMQWKQPQESCARAPFPSAHKHPHWALCQGLAGHMLNSPLFLSCKRCPM